MMDSETSWQDATLNANDLIGPVKPDEGDNAVDAAGSRSAQQTDDEFDDLESGIASIFAALQAANEEDPTEDGAADELDEDDGLADAHTFQLLSELDRLWQRAG